MGRVRIQRAEKHRVHPALALSHSPGWEAAAVKNPKGIDEQSSNLSKVKPYFNFLSQNHMDSGLPNFYLKQRLCLN